MTISAYQHLERRFARLADLAHADGILGWDERVMMPRGSAAGRASALATLAVITHEQLTSPRVGDWLAEAEQAPPVEPWAAANLREMRRQHAHATALPADLVEASSLASSACEMLWEEARPASDFARIAPSLAEVLRLSREIATVKAAAFGCSPYDALLDEYEPGGKSATIDAHFADLAGFLPGFIAEAIEAQGRLPAPSPLAPSGPFPVAAQDALGTTLMLAVGFNEGSGRKDVSMHPFCGGAIGDVRITTRYDEAEFLSSIMSVLHETGHAMYEQGLPAAWARQPVGLARGMSIHESQSLLVEMQVACGLDFLTFAAPQMAAAFGASGEPTFHADNLFRLATRVQRSLIRVDADEVTYPVHVILRYRLEQAMIAGDLAVRDLPSAWSEGLKELLGITPPDDRRGCLQDPHWYGGSFGYFPTYTLGAMSAAQLFAAAREAVPAIPAALRQGDFKPLMGWLRTNVHGQGSLMSSDDLMKQATGGSLTTAAYKRHLRARYLA